MQVYNSDSCIKLGSRLAAIRNKCHLTQEQLSEKANVTSRYISDIERGQVNPSYDILRALIIALNISADDLFFPDQAPDDPNFRKLTASYRKCPENKRAALAQTVDFLIETLLSDGE
mgnify:CR=1 FL=1